MVVWYHTVPWPAFPGQFSTGTPILSQRQSMKVSAYRDFLVLSTLPSPSSPQRSPLLPPITGYSSHRAEPLPQQMASQLDTSHCPAQPPGGWQARHQEAGRRLLACLEPLSAGAWSPTVPWGQIHHLVAALHQAGTALGSSGPSPPPGAGSPSWPYLI